jgi:hypothetical protein
MIASEVVNFTAQVLFLLAYNNISCVHSKQQQQLCLQNNG